MAGFKNKLGPIKVCLERDQVNALLSMLDTMVLGGSFLQVLERQEDQRRNAESGAVPNGQTDADAPLEPPRMYSRRR